MPDRRTDPLDALRAPITPLAPDPAFAARLRRQLVDVLPTPQSKEPQMSTETTDRLRNGYRHGDVSYVTLVLPDVARGRAFYGAVLGWHFSPGGAENSVRVDEIIPMTGLWDGNQSDGTQSDGSWLAGAVLAFRVDDIVAAVAAVRSHGGTVTDPHPEPYAMAAEGHDNQGVPFYLHQLPAVAVDALPAADEFHNGDVQGDVSYLTMVIPDLDAAQAFYGGVFGWSFNVGRAGGAQVTGVAPQMGMTTQPEAGPVAPGVILSYRVDDLAATLVRVGVAGGQAGEIVSRPYGLECRCADDQGTPFYLHQF